MKLSHIFGTAWMRGVVTALFALLALVLFFEASGLSSRDILLNYFLMGLSSKTAFLETLVKATPICLCALAAAVPARFGLINIGGEGQLLAGAIGASAVTLLPSPPPDPLLLPLMAFAGMASGALWAFLPGILRATTRTSEVVSSLLANYVAALGVLYLVNGPWRDPASFGWAQSPSFADVARLPLLPSTRIHLLVALAPIAALAVAVAFRYSTIGRTARLTSASEETARVIGLRPNLLYVGAFLIAGTFAGLAGFGEVAAIHGRLREGISLGYGFAGFLVAWICRNRFAWLPVAAFAIASLLTAGDALQISAGLPFATVDLLQGVILLAFVIFQATSSSQNPTLPATAMEDGNG